MYELKDDRLFIDGTDDERRLVLKFNEAMACHWEDPKEKAGRRLVFASSFAVSGFYDQMCRMNEHGFLFGALLFARRAGELERQVRSHLLTRLIRAQYDWQDCRRPVRESEVSHAAGFINALIGDMTETILEWVEDMNTDDPRFDLECQPTPVIRGMLFSVNLDQRKTSRFWGLAAGSARFPDRVFFDPCPPANGSIFMPYHVKVIGSIFSLAPEAAVRRFSRVIKERAVNKAVLISSDDNRSWRVELHPASDIERSNVLNGILSNVSNERRPLVAEIFA